MSKDVKSFFESHFHRYVDKPDFYSLIAREVKNLVVRDKQLSLLDVGCGDGRFIKALIKEGVSANYVAMDLSFNMLSNAATNLNCKEVQLFLADAFKLPLKDSLEFDVIHVDSVLHHLIGRTRGKSMKLVEKMLNILNGKLSANGVLIIEEVYYSSYLIPTITSFLVFYGLKLINFFRLDLSFTKEIRPGLEVNFLHEKQLIKNLEHYGSVVLLHKEAARVPRTYQVFLLKESGHITYSIRKK